VFTSPLIAKARQRLIGLTIGSAVALAAVCVLAPFGALAASAGDPIPLLAATSPSYGEPASTAPAGPASTAPAGPASAGEIGYRLSVSTPIVVGGERLRGPLLRQFYAAHNFQPVWQNRNAQAEALLGAVMRAGEHGLDPDLFHASLLRNAASLPATDRELLLSDAFLGYADALARGVIPVEARGDNETLSPEPIDIAAVLTQAMSSGDPAAAIERLAPTSQTYMTLRRALHSQLEFSGGRIARTGNKSADDRVRVLAVNLERQRWLPRRLPADRVWVSTVDGQLSLYRDDRPIFYTRVIVGQTDPDNQSPDMLTQITGIVLNPPWNVPYSIISKEIMPKLARDPGYLSRHRMVMRPNGGIQQVPGPGGTALGFLKFEMPNRHDVYLHDTPNRELFGRDNRRLSHGCVRVQNPRELASLVLQQSIESINSGISGGSTAYRMLSQPMPVILFYQTAFVDANGALSFRPDVYNRDERIWQRLQPARQAPVAQHEPRTERRG
jgi:murein L,D-transpeptidase YcbB/YkuD